MRENTTQEPLSPFQTEVVKLFQRTEVNLASGKNILRGLIPSSSDEALPLDQIIENYEHLFGSKGPIPIEKLLLEALPAQDFVDAGLSRYYPRMYRGLPRLYHRGAPSQSHIKKNFTHLPGLKKEAVDRALCSLYGKMAVKGQVTVFSWIPEDDYVGAIEIARILRSRLPHATIRFVALVQAKWAARISFFEGSVILSYEEDLSMAAFTEEALETLRASDLILQVPTYYPHTEELMAAVPGPKMEFVGDYGFVESRWFHPKSGRHSLGLHFLEKGMIIRKPCVCTWQNVQNAQLQAWHSPDNHFYLAYLSSSVGGAVYLHSLLKSLESDPKNIDICTPDLDWFVQFVEKQNRVGKPVIEWELGVGSIEVYFGDQVYSRSIASAGKVVRILCPDAISQGDFRALLALSGDWVAVRGSQSFSEAVSQNKAFFFDGRQQNRYLMKDLIAIAENRIAPYFSALSCLRGMNQSFLYNLPLQEGEWVDEIHFQDLDEWTAIALSLGLALQDPEAIAGFKKLNQILSEEFSANSYLCHLVQRALCHRQNPELEAKEELDQFASNSKTFAEWIKSFKALV